MSAAALGLATDGLDDSAVKTFDETIGLWPVGSCEAVVDTPFGTDLVERVAAGGSIIPLVLHVDGEAIGELAAVVGEDGVNAMREVDQEAFEEAAGGIGIAFGMDFQIDVAGGAVDGDEGIALAPFQGRQMLDIDMNEADGGLLEDADLRLVGFGSPVEGMTFETTMDGAAGKLGIDAAAHHLGDVIERQLQMGPQFTHERFIHCRQTGCHGLWRVRAMVDAAATAPAADRSLADPQVGSQFRDRLLAPL